MSQVVSVPILYMEAKKGNFPSFCRVWSTFPNCTEHIIFLFISPNCVEKASALFGDHPPHFSKTTLRTLRRPPSALFEDYPPYSSETTLRTLRRPPSTLFEDYPPYSSETTLHTFQRPPSVLFGDHLPHSSETTLCTLRAHHNLATGRLAGYQRTGYHAAVTTKKSSSDA